MIERFVSSSVSRLTARIMAQSEATQLFKTHDEARTNARDFSFFQRRPQDLARVNRLPWPQVKHRGGTPMIRSMCVGTAGLLLFASIVGAQPLRVLARQQAATSFEELKLRAVPGETVYVVDVSGQETRGRVASLSDVLLTVTIDGTRRQFDTADVRRIDRRRRDAVGNGLLIGAGAGAVAGFAVGRTLDSPACPRSAAECGQGAAIGAVGGAFWGAVGGWITDALIRKRETIYLGHGSR